jgi:hypothetical protein
VAVTKELPHSPWGLRGMADAAGFESASIGDGDMLGRYHTESDRTLLEPLNQLLPFWVLISPVGD